MSRVPIVVHARDPDELHFFPSAETAGAYLEPIDVAENEYAEVFDREGRPYQLITTRRSRPAFFGMFQREDEIVEVVPLQTDSPNSDQLAVIVRAFLSRSGHAAPAEATLGELVDLAIDRVGYTGAA